MIFDNGDQLQIRHECERMVITARQRNCGKVMFSVVSVNEIAEGNVFSLVCLSFCPQGSFVTITHDALDLTVQGPPPHCPMLLTSGGHDGRHVVVRNIFKNTDSR